MDLIKDIVIIVSIIVIVALLIQYLLDEESLIKRYISWTEKEINKAASKAEKKTETLEPSVSTKGTATPKQPKPINEPSPPPTKTATRNRYE